jgi:hypothetical protein
MREENKALLTTREAEVDMVDPERNRKGIERHRTKMTSREKFFKWSHPH